MMLCDKLKHEVSQKFLLHNKFILSHNRTFVLHPMEATLYHDYTTHNYCNGGIFSFFTCELLQHTVSCCASFVGYIIKHLFIKIYALLKLEHKNDITVLIKLHRATSRSIQKFDIGLHRISVKH